MPRLNWGLVGGGEGSQIGPAHRTAAAADGQFTFAACALDVDPAEGRAFGTRLGVPSDRSYGDWREMLAGERGRLDGVDLVTIATPNSTHHEIAKAFLEAGIHVLCEKPMTTTVAQAQDLVATTKRTGAILAVNFGYSGYPLVRQMRAMIAAGELGAVRLVRVDFAHGFHADADPDNPRLRWRYDPAQAGASAQFADCGSHALHLTTYVLGRVPEKLSADFVSAVASRALEDDAMVNLRMEGGTSVRLWTSAVAVGRMHGLQIEVFGEKAGLAWRQQWPEQLRFTRVGGRTEIIERGEAGLSPLAARGSRVAIGHPEGFPLAFANIYGDLAEQITARKEKRAPHPLALHVPTAQDGLVSAAAIAAAVRSASEGGRWVDARPQA